MSKLLPINLYIRQALLYPLVAPFLPPENKVEKDYSYAAGRLKGTLEAGTNYGLPRTSQTTSQRTGDDGYHEKGYTTERPQDDSVRYTDNGDGTITDNATGLMWVKDPINNPGAPFNAKMNWYNAVDECDDLIFAGHSDWRLPNYLEILSILDLERNSPAVNPTYFPNTPNDAYWCSTNVDRLAATYGFRLWLLDGEIIAKAKTTLYYVRPVRGGQPT